MTSRKGRTIGTTIICRPPSVSEIPPLPPCSPHITPDGFRRFRLLKTNRADLDGGHPRLHAQSNQPHFSHRAPDRGPTIGGGRIPPRDIPPHMIWRVARWHREIQEPLSAKVIIPDDCTSRGGGRITRIPPISVAYRRRRDSAAIGISRPRRRRQINPPGSRRGIPENRSPAIRAVVR